MLCYLTSRCCSASFNFVILQILSLSALILLNVTMPNPFGQYYHKENHDIVPDDLSYHTVSSDALAALCDSMLNYHRKSQPQVHNKYQNRQFLHHAVFTALGINYNNPLTPMEVFQREAACRNQRLWCSSVAEVFENHGSTDTSNILRFEPHNSHASNNSKNCHSCSSAADSPSSDDQGSKEVKVGCCVCFDDLQEIFHSNRHLMATFCGHIFCNSCLDVVVKTNPFCPVCRKKIAKKNVHRIYL